MHTTLSCQLTGSYIYVLFGSFPCQSCLLCFMSMSNGVQRRVYNQTICSFQWSQKETVGLDPSESHILSHKLCVILAAEASFLSLHVAAWLSLPLPSSPNKLWFGVTSFPSFLKDEIHASLFQFLIFFRVILDGNSWKRSYDGILIWCLHILCCAPG